MLKFTRIKCRIFFFFPEHWANCSLCRLALSLSNKLCVSFKLVLTESYCIFRTSDMCLKRLSYSAHSCGCWLDSAPQRLLDGGLQFLAGWWPEATLTFFHMGTSSVAICFLKVHRRARELESKTDITILGSLTVPVISHHLSHILTVGNKPLGHPILRERELHRV